MVAAVVIQTDLGRDKLAKLAAEGKTLKLTQFAVGDANDKPYTPTGKETKLVHEKYRSDISLIEKDEVSAATLKIINIVPSTSGGYTIHEIGLFDEDNDLVAIGVCEIIKPDPKIVPYTSKITILLTIDNAESVEFKINIEGYVTHDYATKNFQSIKFKQDSDSAVERVLLDKVRETVSVKDFGAVGDGIHDDTAAIQNAINFAAINGAFLVGNAAIYKISKTLYINCDCDLSQMRVNTSITSNLIAIYVTSQPLHQRNITLPKLYNISHLPGDGWKKYEESVGVYIATINDSRISIPLVTGFGVGVRVAGGDGAIKAGTCYNNFYVGSILNNRINLYIGRQENIANEEDFNWTNDNTFFIGKCRHDSNESNAGSAYPGTRNILIKQANNNLLMKPCIEGSTAATELTLELNDCAFNTIINPRWEGHYRAKIESSSKGYCTGNVIIGGYDYNNLMWTVVGEPTCNTVFGNGRGKQSLQSGGEGISVNNVYADSVAAPHFQGFASNNTLLNSGRDSTEYAYRIYTYGLAGKRPIESQHRMIINWQSGLLTCGPGGDVAPTNVINGSINGSFLITANILPSSASMYNLGAATYRWKAVYADTSAITAADERSYEQISDIDERIFTAWQNVKFYQYKDKMSVAQKGLAARLHIGAIAQQIKKCFDDAGLDAFQLGLLCYDEWMDEPAHVDELGNEIQAELKKGNSYSIRYEELLALECAYLRNLLKEINK